jgi:hypothetical protein
VIDEVIRQGDDGIDPSIVVIERIYEGGEVDGAIPVDRLR